MGAHGQRRQRDPGGWLKLRDRRKVFGYSYGRWNDSPVLEVAMRSFMSACIAAAVIAIVAAAILDLTLQKSAATAFSTSAVRFSK